MPNPQAGEPPFICFTRLLIQYIRSWHPYLETFSICNLRTRHAIVTRNPRNVVVTNISDNILLLRICIHINIGINLYLIHDIEK
jgi:hypothetical protein